MGHIETLSAKRILSLRPSLVLASEDVGPPVALQRLRTAGVPVLRLTALPVAAGAVARIVAVSRALGLDAEGTALITNMCAQGLRPFEVLRSALVED